jgi:hypothetical protein
VFRASVLHPDVGAGGDLLQLGADALFAARTSLSSREDVSQSKRIFPNDTARKFSWFLM